MADAPLRFTHVVVDSDNPPDPHCKAAGDLDGDGRAELLAASARSGGLYWYRYPGWTKHRVAKGSFTTDMAVADLFGTGCLDIVIPGDDGLMAYRNPRSHGGDPAAGPWEAVNLGPAGARMHDVAVGDLNGDGRLDLVTRHQSGFGRRLGNQIHLWVQRHPDRWEHRPFPCPHGEGLEVADVDGDGRLDVVIGGRWYRNPGDPLAGEWVEHLYMPEERLATGWTQGDVVVRVGDLDRDGRAEIVVAPAEGAGSLSCFHAGAGTRDSDWQEQVIDPDYEFAHGLALGDLDGDGWLDLAVARMHQATPPQEVCVYRNRDGGRRWVKEVLATTGSHNIVLADVRGTGRLDLFGANWNDRSPTGGALELWLNEGG